MKHLRKNRVLLRNSQGIQLAPKADLVYLQAEGSYTDYYLLKNGELQRKRQSKHLAWHAKNLDDDFERINPQIVINLDHVAYIYNNHTVVLDVPTKPLFNITPTYWKRIKQLFDL